MLGLRVTASILGTFPEFFKCCVPVEVMNPKETADHQMQTFQSWSKHKDVYLTLFHDCVAKHFDEIVSTSCILMQFLRLPSAHFAAVALLKQAESVEQA